MKNHSRLPCICIVFNSQPPQARALSNQIQEQESARNIKCNLTWQLEKLYAFRTLDGGSGLAAINFSWLVKTAHSSRHGVGVSAK